MSALDVSIHNSLEEVEPFWRQAEAGLQGTAFQAFDLVACWARNAPRRRDFTLQIVVVRDDKGTPLLLMPLYIRRWRGLRILGTMADDVSDYTAPLVGPAWFSHVPQQAFPAFFQRVAARLAPFDILSLRRMPDLLGALPNPYRALPGATPGLAAFAASLPTDFEAYLDRRRRKIHHDTERQIRRLSSLGPLTYERALEPARVQAVVSHMLAQKEARFPAPPAQATPAHRAHAQAYYEAMGALRSPLSEGHVSALKVGEDIVATHVGLVQGHRFHYVMPGFEAGHWARYSPGRVLMEFLIRECIERGLGTFDMTIGDESYKKLWVDGQIRLHDLVLGHSLLGRAFARARSAARSLRNALQQRHNPTFRTGGRAP